MKRLYTLCALLGVWQACYAGTYDNYQALVLGPVETKEQLHVIDFLRDEDTRTRKIQILQDVLSTGYTVDMIVSPDRMPIVIEALRNANIKYQQASDDVQRDLDETMLINTALREQWLEEGKTNPPEFYMEWEEQLAYIKELADASSIAEYSTFGTTFEGREMPLVTINGDRSDLPGIWLDAGVHCREWLAQATAIHILETILNGLSTEATDLRFNYRIYVVPNGNPDGYVYTWTDDRYWRKNRSGNGGCGGVDLNRNFDVNYDFCGTSANPCSDTYSGPGAASEIETQAFVDRVKRVQSDEGGLELFVSMHSYAQFWLVPWGGSNFKPADYDELMAAANEATAAIRAVDGRTFTAGTVPDLLYCAAGGSFDWAKNDGNLPGDGAGIKYSYTPELRPDYGCCGLFGFNPDPSNIDPSGREIFAGFYANIKAVA